MKIAILGRSHMAALKNALDEGKADAGGHVLTFFGAPNRSFREELRMKDGVLTGDGAARAMFLRTSVGAADHLDPRVFDAVVIYGSHFHMQTFFSALIRGAPGPGVMGHSRAALHDAAQAWMAQMPTLEILRGFRAACPDTPLLLMFEPFYGERYAGKLPEGVTLTPAQRDAVFDGLADAVRDVGAEPLFQPADTVAQVMYSQDAFSHGSRRLSDGSEHDDGDLTHLNSDFGAIALAVILERLARG